MAFFDEKKAAAVLKHSLLSYVTPFASKAGINAPDQRVSVVDGYAGEGRYEDGSDGSPLRLIEIAREALPKRRIELHLVEKHGPTFTKLEAAVAEKLGDPPDVPVMRYNDAIETKLDLLLKQAQGIPLFTFLDPYGLLAPFDLVGTIFERPGGYGAPATEALINFSMPALNRTAGHIGKVTGNAKTLARMDTVCGGDWWQQIWLDASPAGSEAGQHAVVVEYARRLSKVAGTGWWAVDVRPRPELQPLYYLIFLSRHSDGLDIFGERVSCGLRDWRAWLTREGFRDTMFDPEEIIKADEEVLRRQWIGRIDANLRAMRAAGVDNFSVMARYSDIFEGIIGEARDLHLRAALKALYDEGLLMETPVGVKRLKQYVVRWQTPGTVA